VLECVQQSREQNIWFSCESSPVDGLKVISRDICLARLLLNVGDLFMDINKKDVGGPANHYFESCELGLYLCISRSTACSPEVTGYVGWEVVVLLKVHGFDSKFE
jgi:hypothetical protein